MATKQDFLADGTNPPETMAQGDGCVILRLTPEEAFAVIQGLESAVSFPDEGRQFLTVDECGHSQDITERGDEQMVALNAGRRRVANGVLNRLQSGGDPPLTLWALSDLLMAHPEHLAHHLLCWDDIREALRDSDYPDDDDTVRRIVSDPDVDWDAYCPSLSDDLNEKVRELADSMGIEEMGDYDDLLKELSEHPSVIAVDLLTFSDMRTALRELGLPDDNGTIRRIIRHEGWAYHDGGEHDGFSLEMLKNEIDYVADKLGLRPSSALDAQAEKWDVPQE